ncbi:hypothetical protein LP419_36215 [Massilia sp. H-1]|nr:hypothetical protein LP419_36215 [Massilia sp. H-1]
MRSTLLRFTSFYLIPLFIGLMSLVALAFWNSQYVATGDQALELQVVRQNAPALAHAELLSRLDGAAPLRQFDVGLQQAPVWFRFTSIGARDLPSVVELPSRHAVDIACWDALTMAPLGASTRSASSGALAPAKSGFALQLTHTRHGPSCAAPCLLSPARLTAIQWPPEQMALSVQQFHRKSGLLDGGMIVLTLFVLTTALINRQLLYVMFGLLADPQSAHRRTVGLAGTSSGWARPCRNRCCCRAGR